MTSKYFFSGLVLLLIACAHTRQATTNTPQYHGDTAIAGGQLMLLGEHPRGDLRERPFARWFDSGFAAYTVDTATVSLLRPLIKQYTFEIFMGTWCGDSRREVPRMFKILDACGVPQDHIRLITLDYRGRMYKQSPGHEENGLDIIHVPDLLVMDGAVEQGRIVESPVVTLEKDLYTIIQGQPYQPQYGAAWWLGNLLRRSPAINDDAVADSLRSKTTHAIDLCLLSYILYLHGDTANAFLVRRLTSDAFPADTAARKWLDGRLLKKG